MLENFLKILTLCSHCISQCYGKRSILLLSFAEENSYEHGEQVIHDKSIPISQFSKFKFFFFLYSIPRNFWPISLYLILLNSDYNQPTEKAVRNTLSCSVSTIQNLVREPISKDSAWSKIIYLTLS